MKIVLWLIMSTFLLAACDAEDKSQAVKSKDSPDKSVVVAAQKSPGVSSDTSGPMALLLPSPLTSADTAQAVLKGCSGRLTYAWEVNGSPLSSEASDRLSNAYFLRDDQVGVQVNCDGIISRSTALVVNSPPKVTEVAFVNPAFVTGEDIELVPQAFDQDDDEVNFSFQWLVDGKLIEGEEEALLPGEYVSRDRTIMVHVTPRDSWDVGPVYRSLAFQPADGVPKFVSKPAGFNSLSYSYQAEAVDPDGDTLVYRLEKGPDGMSIDSTTGELVWQIEPGTSGEFQVTIVAVDPGGNSARQEYSLTLTLQE